MTNRMLIVPAEGRLVRHPDTRRLAAEGESVVVSSYWIRRLKAGDVVEVKEPVAAPVAPVAADPAPATKEK